MLSHTAIEGIFDFNKTHLAPPGIKVLVHKNYNSVKLGESMEYQDGTSGLGWSTIGAIPAIHQTPGMRDI